MIILQVNYITSDWLRVTGMSEEDISRFCHEFGGSTRTMPSTLRRMAACGMDMDALARRLLPFPGHRADYERLMSCDNVAYDQAIECARDCVRVRKRVARRALKAALCSADDESERVAYDTYRNSMSEQRERFKRAARTAEAKVNEAAANWLIQLIFAGETPLEQF